MDAKSFYGNLSYVNEIANGLESDDEYISDTDDEVLGKEPCEQENVYMPETDESDSDDICCKPTSSNAKQSKKARVPIWKESCLAPYTSESYPFQGNANLPSFIEELETPAEFFSFFFSDHLLNDIVEQLNLVANISRNEMEQFIGKTIYY